MSTVHSPHVEKSVPMPSLPRKSSDEHFVICGARPGESLLELLKRAAHEVSSKNSRILSMTLFNGRAEYAAVEPQIPTLFGDIRWPITRLHSEASSPDVPAGIEIHMLADPAPQLEPICLHGRVVGNWWDDADARYCVLGDLRASNTDRTAAIQTQDVFEDMLAALKQADMTFHEVYRTWFRNRDILAWYNDFNRVRTEFFNRQHVFDGLLPASTGISAGNPHDAALVTGLWAMRPKTQRASARVVESPLQDSARCYGSSFSRAVEVQRGALHHLTISGTASIGRDGKTLYAGDIDAQINWTMQVVEAILHSRHMGWADVARGLVYFRSLADVAAYERWSRTHGVTLPVITVNHTVCRDDLLYEIELDAQKNHSPVR